MLNGRQLRIYFSAETQSIGWCGKSKIARLACAAGLTIANGEKELLVLGYKFCCQVVRLCLTELGYSLQANKKTKNGLQNLKPVFINLE